MAFLEGSDIKADRCIVVNANMQTNVPNVYAAGDVTSPAGIWPSAIKQGRVAASNMCGRADEYIDTYAFKNTINFFGLVSLSVGVTQIEAGDKVEIQEDKNAYKMVGTRDGK